MPRSALKRFFQRVLVATLPLAAACHDDAHGDAVDLSAAVPDLETTVGPDLSDPIYAPAPDTCEIDHPPTFIALPPGFDTDGGVGGCVAGDVCARSGCPTDYTVCCEVAGDGGMQLMCSYYCATGRRPAGLAAAPATAGNVVGRYFADVAHLEAASVHAFARLADELVQHGAPARHVRAARRARRDEIRHARVTAAFARAHGATPTPVRVTAPAPRSLEELAVENGVEGCVRETFGALLAAWQARTAGDAAVRRAMARIAADETRHAELAWEIDAWVRPRLDRAARGRLRQRRRAAVAELERELEAGAAPELVRRAGLPDVAQSRALFAAARPLWRDR